MKRYLIFLLLGVSFFACENKSNDASQCQTVKVDADNTEYNFGDIVDTSTVEFIQLETKDECLLGNRLRFWAKNNTIYIKSNNRIYVFDDEGNFKFKFGKIGKGPGEYLDIEDVCIKDSLYIYSVQSSKILIYDNKGNYISERKINVRSAIAFEKIEGNLFAFSMSNNYNPKSHRLVIENIEDHSNKSFIHEKQEILRWQKILGLESFALYKDNILLRFIADDTIYKVTPTSATPFINVDFGKYTLPSTIRNKEYKDIQEFREEEKYKYASTFNFFSTDKHLSISYYVSDSQAGVITFVVSFYNWETNNTLVISRVKNFPLVANVTTQSYVLTSVANTDEYFYSAIYQSTLLDLEKKGGILKIKPNINSNPILMKFKPKI